MPERRREVLRAGDLSDADIAALSSTEMDPKYRCFDNELEAEIPSLPSSSPVWHWPRD